MSKSIEANIEKFSYGTKTIFENIHFSVEQGECVVITGLSGCGKTSFLRLLNSLIPTLYEGNVVGQIKILGKPLSDYKAGELAKYIGNVCELPIV